MINIDWKEGSISVENTIKSEEYETYEIIYGENDYPFFRHGLDPLTKRILDFKFYIEYNVQVYGHNKNTDDLDLVCEKKFNCKNQNLVFELYPQSEEDVETWTSYLERFSQRKQFNSFCIIKNDFKINSDIIKVIDNLCDIDYYSKYKICWDHDYNINPRGWINFNSFDLINNCLFKI